MRTAAVLAHLDALDLVPELRDALRQMVEHDSAALEQREHWTSIIPVLERMLGLDAAAVAPFTIAWSMMYRAIVHLDHLQDGDPDDNPLFQSLPHPGVGYNLTLAYYTLATHVLHTLAPEAVSPSRAARLHTLWTTQMLRMAGGQLLDLTMQRTGHPLPLDTYQTIAEYKTGATYALLFGGLALLAGEPADVVDHFTVAGELYGLLLQCSDDLRDTDTQPNAALTLPVALAESLPSTLHDRLPSFWTLLYQQSYAYLQTVLAPLPDAMQRELRQLFVEAFGTPEPPA